MLFIRQVSVTNKEDYHFNETDSVENDNDDTDIHDVVDTVERT